MGLAGQSLGLGAACELVPCYHHVSSHGGACCWSCGNCFIVCGSWRSWAHALGHYCLCLEGRTAQHARRATVRESTNKQSQKSPQYRELYKPLLHFLLTTILLYTSL